MPASAYLRMFFSEFAPGSNRANVACGPLGMAHFPPVPNEEVVRSRPILLWDRLHEPFLDGAGRLALGKPEAVGDAEYMGIHRNGIAAEGDGVYDVGSLSPDARKRLEGYKVVRDFPAEFGYDIRSCREDVRRLAVIEPAGVDILLQFLL